MVISIDRDGTIRMLYDDRARGLLSAGRSEIRRASHVEPTSKGRWTADLSPVEGPSSMGPFGTRAEALDAERKWLEARL